jgi:cytochrome b6-f complex iron-sulfur subunit
MAKKLSTEEILKAARAQSAKVASPSEPSAEAPAAQPPELSAAEAAPAPPADPKPAAAPKSTKDILAAARAQSTGGAAAASAPKPAAPSAPAGGAPKSTKDILAAARAQTAGGAAPAAAGAPKSTKDILAAARAQTQGGAAPAAAEKPAAAKAAAVKAAPAAAKPAGNRPSVQEMLKAAREGRPVDGPAAAGAATATVATAKPAAAALVIPQKPAPAAKKPEPIDEARRGFLASMSGGMIAFWAIFFGTAFRAAWTSFTAASGLAGLYTARFMMPNVLVEPPSKFKVGPVSDYPPAAVSTKWTAQYGVWVVHNEYKGKDVIYALLTVCTHLGCTPNWLEGERKFKCPCHGSGYYITGVNFEGPAPRPLERMAIRVAEDGALEVDKSRKFQEEMGQWNDPASFVPVA